MTLDDLSRKMDERFDRTDGKLDSVATTVAVHTTTLAVHDRENKDLKDRVTKLERWMWASIGSGAAAGTLVGKFFLQ